MVLQLSVLDTGAALDVINPDLIPPPLWKSIRFGRALDIADANNQPIRTYGYINFVVGLGTSSELVKFIVCESLAAPIVLGCDFCDHCVEAIRPPKRIVEMTDGSLIPIVRTAMRRRKHVLLRAAQKAEDHNPV